MIDEDYNIEDENDVEDIEEQESLYEHFRFTVDKGQQPIRIDKYLFDKIVNIQQGQLR